MNSSPRNNEHSSVNDKKKKKYLKPEIQVYGNLREITRNISGGTGAMDGGSPSSLKTSA